jgi:uncharacterized RDD family membrane protein YckC
MKRASLFARFLAILVDLSFLVSVSVLLFVSGLIGVVMGVGVSKTSFCDLLSAIRAFVSIFFFFEIFLFLFYFTYLTARGENTFGKRIFRLRVVRRRDNAPVGVTRSLARALAYWLSALPLFLGFCMAVVSGGRALHDVIAGTAVVKEE